MLSMTAPDGFRNSLVFEVINIVLNINSKVKIINIVDCLKFLIYYKFTKHRPLRSMFQRHFKLVGSSCVYTPYPVYYINHHRPIQTSN